MSDRTVVRTVIETRAVSRAVGITGPSSYQSYLDTTEDNPPLSEAAWLVSLKGADGTDGKDAYQSYLDTTEDNPPLTEAAWSAGGGGGVALTSYATQIATLSDYPLTFPPTIGDWATDARTPTAHQHPISEISDWPTEFPPASHQHVSADIADASATWAGNVAVLYGIGNVSVDYSDYTAVNRTYAKTESIVGGKPAFGDYPPTNSGNEFAITYTDGVWMILYQIDGTQQAFFLGTGQWPDEVSDWVGYDAATGATAPTVTMRRTLIGAGVPTSTDAQRVLAITTNPDGLPSQLSNGAISGTLTINSTTITFGAGAQTALRTALGLGSAAYTASTDYVTASTLSTWAGTANIVTVGTITTGTWSGTAIAIAKGGTGATTAAAAATALGLGSSNSPSFGGITIYGGTATSTIRLVTNGGNVLSGAITSIRPSATAPGGYAADMSFSVINSVSATNEVFRITADQLLGLGTTTPTKKLDVVGTVGISGVTTHAEDVEITNSAKGIILKDSNGVRYRVTVNTSGELVVTAL